MKKYALNDFDIIFGVQHFYVFAGLALVGFRVGFGSVVKMRFTLI